jgi:glucokinase
MGATKLAAGIGGADGEITRSTEVPTRASEGAEAVLSRALELAERVRDEDLAAGGSINAIGISTMGYTHETHVELATNVPGWTELRIPAAVERTFLSVPATIGNDVHAAAKAEMAWGSLLDVSDGIYFNLGSGISAGIISGGHFLNGANGAAGEVGYSLFRGAEERMAADGVGPFEAWFGGTGAACRLATTGLPGSVAEVLALSGDPAADAFIDELFTGIAVMVANLCSSLNPSVVSLGGGYVRGASGVLERISELLAQAVPYPPAVVRARFGADASLRGAVAIALTAAGALA